LRQRIFFLLGWLHCKISGRSRENSFITAEAYDDEDVLRINFTRRFHEFSEDDRAHPHATGGAAKFK
jgi:hypothetical protein